VDGREHQAARGKVQQAPRMLAARCRSRVLTQQRTAGGEGLD
jgi:hypothetical protein